MSTDFLSSFFVFYSRRRTEAFGLARIMAPPGDIVDEVKVKMYFVANETLTAEMARMGRLRREKPDQAKAIMDHGQHLIQLVSKGNLRALIGTLESTPKVSVCKELYLFPMLLLLSLLDSLCVSQVMSLYHHHYPGSFIAMVCHQNVS